MVVLLISKCVIFKLYVFLSKKKKKDSNFVLNIIICIYFEFVKLKILFFCWIFLIYIINIKSIYEYF